MVAKVNANHRRTSSPPCHDEISWASLSVRQIGGISLNTTTAHYYHTKKQENAIGDVPRNFESLTTPEWVPVSTNYHTP
ncbi:hypothetical protein TNCV_3622891 [Trichonephila clavipes]|nr:hypothetical protein TNCV_3622891 [Trichonephila clavipes]